ncbi:MAG: hypothetical protein ACJA1U_000743 [Bermanella sp.]|jgi:hypothetical protein
MKSVLLVVFIALLTACSTAPYQSIDQIEASSSDVLAQLPNWYHQNLGLQLNGGNAYPAQTALASLLKQADLEFIRGNFQACQILLERAQRISTREPSVYVRLSYLFWLENNTRSAEQMARRALALVVRDAQASEEVKRLLLAIQANQY